MKTLKKKHLLSALAATFIIIVGLGMQGVLAKPDGPLTIRYEATGKYDIVAGGVGLNEDDTGDILLDVPGKVVQAYLYWAGNTGESGGPDDTVLVSVNGGPDETVPADWTYGPDPWIDGTSDHYVYVADVTSLTLSGSNTYTVSGLDIGYDYGAGLMVVYKDKSLPYSNVKIFDGLDAFHFDFGSPQGPDSEVNCVDLSAASYDRSMDMTLIVGGVQHDDRPNAVWYQAGAGVKPTNLVDEVDATKIDGPPYPYPLRASDGYQWDTYAATVTVPAGSEWSCVQIESVDTIPPYGEEEEGKGCSALFLASGFVCETPLPPGTGTPGYWKNHPEAWPVDEITIGGVNYPRDDAIEIMKTPGKGDKTYTMFSALVAAKLNVLIGNPSSCIEDTITDADEWMATNGPVGNGVKAKSDAWQVNGESLYEMLDDYNNGLLCAPSRD